MCDCAKNHLGIECGEEDCHCHSEETRDDSDGGIERALSSLLNSYCAENVSGTPDFILAKFMIECLKSYNEAVVRRSAWRGEDVELPSLQRLNDSKES